MNRGLVFIPCLSSLNRPDDSVCHLGETERQLRIKFECTLTYAGRSTHNIRAIRLKLLRTQELQCQKTIQKNFRSEVVGKEFPVVNL